MSNPHFYQSDPSLLEAVEGLKPNKTLHDTFFKIQPVCFDQRNLFLWYIISTFLYVMYTQSIGVPLEGKVRVQLNLKVEQAKHIKAVQDFRDFVFPIMWVEEVRKHE